MFLIFKLECSCERYSFARRSKTKMKEQRRVTSVRRSLFFLFCHDFYSTPKRCITKHNSKHPAKTPTRRKICENLACLGVKIDLEANKAFGEFAKLSTDDSSIGVYVVPTNEELMIARDTLFLAKNS